MRVFSLEWSVYRWGKFWPTSSDWRPTRRSPLEVSTVEGLYFVGSTVEVDCLFQDLEANSALQVPEKISRRSGISKNLTE